MSIKVYSLLSGETEKLKDKDIEISVNDENNIDIIRGGDPKDYPKFSCLYNKEEIDIKLVSDYLDKNGLESFGALNIMGGKGIYTWNTDGTLTTKIQYCASLNKLYERLRDSAKNLEVFLTKMREDVDSGIAPGATLKYFTGEISDKDIIEEEYDVSTYKKLIEALTANQKGMLDVMNLMIQNIDEVNNAIVPSIDWNTLKDLKIIVEHVDETTKAITYGTDTIKPKNMETIIKELSTSNDNISKWIKNNTVDFTEIEPIKYVDLKVNETTNETIFDVNETKINNMKDFAEKTNTTAANITKWIDALNDQTISYETLLNLTGGNTSMCLINKTTGEPEIHEVKIEIDETPPPTPTPEPTPDPTPTPTPTPTEPPKELVNKEDMVYVIPPIDELKKLEEYTIPKIIEPEVLKLTVSKFWLYSKKTIGWIKDLLYNIISTTLSLAKQPIKLTYKTIAFATKEFMKIIYNLFYFIWYGIDSIVDIAYEAVKDNEKVGVIFYIGGEDADADFKDVDLHQVIDEIKELTPRLNNKIDELKNEGIRMIKIAYSSFTLFWSNLWHFIVDFIMNYPNLVNNIIQIGGNWIDAQFWQYIGGYSDLILYVYVILVYAIAGGLGVGAFCLCVILIAALFEPIGRGAQWILNKITRHPPAPHARTLEVDDNDVVNTDDENSFDIVDPDGNKIVIEIDDDILEVFRNQYNSLVSKYQTIYDVVPSTPSTDSKYFTLKESDQLYLYRPSKTYEESNYYCMRWDIDKDYDIPLNLVFRFKDYLFGHNWELTWDGKNWTGNNCQNMCTEKISYMNTNDGAPALTIKHNERIGRWIKGTIKEDLTDDDNYAHILKDYLTNWRVVKKDGTILSEGITATFDSSGSGTLTQDGYKYEQARMYVDAPSGLNADDGLYVYADLNINGNITELKWDCHPTHCINSGVMHTYGSNPCLESFNYHREKRHSIKIIEGFNHKNIRIYIEKELFDFDVKVNPFDIIIQQQFYEVEPDPRKCTTISTDYNIYSSKIIWADNIMTMRRDLNVVGGITDILAYDYALLKQTVDNLVEQMRIQAMYNEYTDSIKQGVAVANSILNILASTVCIASALSTLNMSNNSVTINTYQTRPFPAGPGGNGGGGGGGGGGYPGDGGSGFQGKFLVNVDLKADKMTMERFLPITTTVQNPVAGAISTFSATQVVLSTTHALTQLGNAIATLGSNVLHFFRNRPDTNGTETLNINSSSITITDNDTDNATNTITTTEQSLERTHREVQPQVVTDETDEIRTDITVPQTTMTNTASTTIALRNQVPVINISGIQYTLEDIADMTREERNALVASHPDILRIQYHGREWFNVYDLFYNDQLIIHNNVFQRRTLIRPADIEMTDRIHRATDNNWSIEWEGTTYTARDIEQLSMQDRLNLPFVQNGDIGLEPYLNDQTMEAWINIIDHRGETIDPIVATIDYSAPTTANISGGQVRFVGINSQIEVNANGVRYQHYDLVATTDTWTVPGTTPAITARMIEQMSDEQRGELMDNIYSHGNLLAFNDTLDETTGEEITQVLYNGNVVATIDRRRLHVINIVNGVIEMYQQDGVISATTQVIMGAVGYVARRFLHGQWQFVRHHPGDAAAIAGVAAEAYVANRIGLFNIPSWFRRNDNPETLAEEDVLEKILAWAYHEETDDEPELEITMKDADKMMVSFDTCINIAKTYRDTLKGTIAFMCEKIKELENKSSTKHPLEDIDMTAYITKVEVKEMIDQKDAYIDTLEARLAALEAKCANIE